MKKAVLIASLFFFLVTSLNAQKTIWFNKEGKITQKENASYYRPVPKEVKNGFFIKDFYKDGSVYMEGFSSVNDFNREKYNGKVTFYYKNGNPSFQLNYKKGVINGVKKAFHETGELKSIIRYKEGKQEGVWKTFYKNGKIKTKGKYKNGEKVGVWKTFYKNVY